MLPNCENCGAAGSALRIAKFEEFEENWCIECYDQYYQPAGPPCQNCPEGIAVHTIISNWRNAVFHLCNDCAQDFAVETEKQNKNNLENRLDIDSQV